MKIIMIGGHATPAFAVLDELISQGRKPNEVVWVGEKYNQRGSKQTSAEYNTINNKYRIRFINLKSGKLHRHFSIGSFAEIFYLFTGFIKSLWIILVNKPSVVMSFGGFLAVPVAFWAWIFRVPVLTHEQTVTPGLANKIIARFASRVLLSWPALSENFPVKKTTLVGNPVRKDVFTVKTTLTKNFDHTKPTVYVTGGNQGAHKLNSLIFEILENLLKHANVIHQTGNSTITKDNQHAVALKEKLPKSLQSNYFIKDYIYGDEIGEVFNKSDLVVSRSGANTVTELLHLGKLAILIPLPGTSKDEQYKNALMLESTGLATVLKQNKTLDAKVFLNQILQGLYCAKNNKSFTGETMSTALSKASSLLVNKDPALKIVENIYSFIN